MDQRLNGLESKKRIIVALTTHGYFLKTYNCDGELTVDVSISEEAADRIADILANEVEALFPHAHT